MTRNRVELFWRSGWLALWITAACSDPAGPPEKTEAPAGVLLVSIDTLRADHLPCYGYERPTAPRLSALAESGILFENATASSSWTLPSHLSMLTGLPVSAHGVCDDRLWTRRDAAGDLVPVPLRGTFVSEVLADEGYRCAGFYSWKYLDDQFGFGPGFETWERLGHTFYSHPVVGPEFERLRAADDVEGMKALAARHPALFDDTHPSSPEVVDRALAWLDEHARDRAGQPFFLFVHLFDVHDPYVPPEPYRSLFDPDYEGPIDGRRVTAADSPVRGDMPPRDLEHLIALYDGGIAWVDSEVGRLLDGLRATGLAQDTLTIVTSDHGEEFFEHGHKAHRRQLHRESVHVPLILSWPAVLEAGQRVPGPVGLVDIAPTLCAAAGVTGAPAMRGADLLELARSGASSQRRFAELHVFADGRLLERHVGIAEGDEYALRIQAPDAEWRAFDLARDPRGLGPGERVAEPQRLEAWLEDYRRAVRDLRATSLPRGSSLRALDEHDLRQLAAMGYAGQGETGSGGGAGGQEAGEREERLCVDGCVWR